MNGKDQYLSPLNHELSTKVPIFMQCGTVEVLYDEQISFFRRMKEVAGNKFEILELENATHDTFLLDKPWGLQKKPRMQHLLHVISLRAKSYNMPCASSLPSSRTRDPVSNPGIASRIKDLPRGAISCAELLRRGRGELYTRANVRLRIFP